MKYAALIDRGTTKTISLDSNSCCIDGKVKKIQQGQNYIVIDKQRYVSCDNGNIFVDCARPTYKFNTDDNLDSCVIHLACGWDYLDSIEPDGYNVIHINYKYMYFNGDLISNLILKHLPIKTKKIIISTSCKYGIGSIDVIKGILQARPDIKIGSHQTPIYPNIPKLNNWFNDELISPWYASMTKNSIVKRFLTNRSYMFIPFVSNGDNRKLFVTYIKEPGSLDQHSMNMYSKYIDKVYEFECQQLLPGGHGKHHIFYRLNPNKLSEIYRDILTHLS